MFLHVAPDKLMRSRRPIPYGSMASFEFDLRKCCTDLRLRSQFNRKSA